jgi:hypothetical protein
MSLRWTDARRIVARVVTILVAIAALLCSTVVTALILRSRRTFNRTPNLGAVSQQWLLIHRAEDR